MESDWLVPFIMMMVVYPLIALEQIGVELQNPFATRNMSHLPLDEITARPSNAISRGFWPLRNWKKMWMFGTKAGERLR